MTSYEPGTAERRGRLAAGVLWALVAAVGFGGFFIVMHEAAEDSFLWPVLVFRLASTTLVLAVALAIRPRLTRSRRDLGTMACIGLADTGGNVLFAAASAQDALVSIVSVLASLYPVVTVLLARIYLRERVGRVQEAGAVATLAGVVLVSAG